MPHRVFLDVSKSEQVPSWRVLGSDARGPSGRHSGPPYVLHLRTSHRGTKRQGAASIHAQVVTYRLADDVADVNDDEFIEANREFAEMMAAVPGLLAKIWLRNADEKVYGGIYLWRDRQAYDDFVASELWASVVSDETVVGLTSNDFAVMEEPTKRTQPVLQLV